MKNIAQTIKRLCLKLLIISGIIAIVPNLSYAQSTSNIDSLKSRLQSALDPGGKVGLLIDIINEYSGNDDEMALLYIRTALVEIGNVDDSEKKADLYYTIGGFNKDHGQYDEAIENFQASLELYIVSENEKEIANLYYSLGDIYKKKGLYQLSLENCLAGMRIFERLNDREGLSDVYNCMGSLCKYQENYIKSIEYYNRSLDLSVAINDIGGMALAYNNIGVVNSIMGNTDLALHNYDHSLELWIEDGSKKNQGIVLGNKASVYLGLNEYEKAHSFIKQSLEIHLDIGYLRGQASQYRNLGRYYNLLHNNELAIENLMKSFELNNTLGTLDDKMEVAMLLSEVLREEGQFGDAFDFFSLSREIGDSIFNLEKMKNIAQLEYDYDRRNEDEIHKLKDQRRAIINTAIFLALFLISVIVALLYSRLRIKVKHQKLHYQNVELEKRQIETELKLKQKELTANTLNLVEKNEIISTIIERLNKAKKNLKDENVPVIINIISDLNASMDSNIWEDFEIRFLQVHQEFYENLQNEIPDLTPNEKRISAFLRLDMSTKEISFITNQSPHSINMARTRLRKKLGLVNTDISLQSFLSGF